ncbi:hypothetical protein [Selenomonas ruminantium]|nr:hypothetical protein [Selenomonas ruminantium]
MPKNQLQPSGLGSRLLNFGTNFFWAIVWLGRHIIRFCKKVLGRG